MRRLLFSALISFGFAAAAEAQTLEETLRRADSLLHQRQYAEAVKLYERAAFFAPAQFQIAANTGLGRAYLGTENYEQSSNAFSRVLDYKIDSAAYGIVIEKTRAELYGKLYSRAELTLEAIDTATYPSYAKQRIFYTAILHYSARNFEPAQIEFLKLAEAEKGEADEINNLFKKLDRSERRSTVAAVLMSILIPGAGQVYAGRPEDGINALLLTGAWTALTISTYQIYGPYHASMTVLPWLLRYWAGGANNAAVLTMQMKAVKRDRIYRKLLKIVSG